MLIAKFDTTGIKEKVTEFENKYSIILPEQYRSFLLKYNGGITPETEFTYKRTSTDISAYYSVSRY